MTPFFLKRAVWKSRFWDPKSSQASTVFFFVFKYFFNKHAYFIFRDRPKSNFSWRFRFFNHNFVCSSLREEKLNFQTFLLFFWYKTTKTRHRLILEDSAICSQDFCFNMLNQTSIIELLSIHHYRRILNDSQVGLVCGIVWKRHI